LADLSNIRKHRYSTNSRIFFFNLTVLYINSGVESVLWKHILWKICAFVHYGWKFNCSRRSTIQFV